MLYSCDSFPGSREADPPGPEVKAFEILDGPDSIVCLVATGIHTNDLLTSPKMRELLNV